MIFFNLSASIFAQRVAMLSGVLIQTLDSFGGTIGEDSLAKVAHTFLLVLDKTKIQLWELQHNCVEYNGGQGKTGIYIYIYTHDIC